VVAAEVRVGAGPVACWRGAQAALAATRSSRQVLLNGIIASMSIM
jgi:hypothetical protein